MIAKSTTKIILLFGLLAIFSSCIQNKNIVYLQDAKNNKNDSTYTNQPITYKIQPNDNLYIRIASTNKDINDLFNSGNSSTSNYTGYTESSLYINGYIISDSGFVSLPVLGNILVADMTIPQAEKAIQEKVNQYLKDAIVSIKMLSYKFTILGEANKPGVYYNYNNNLTVLEAIGMAGDISIYGNKKDILIIRPSKEGNKTYRIDLTKNDLLASNKLYILPNDIIYIEPVKAKARKIDLPNLALLLSSISTLVLVLNYLRIK